MRLSKFLSLSIAMSRNQAKFFIRKGRVSVDGDLVTEPNFELTDTSHVIFDGKPISIVAHHYVLLNKPVSYICTTKTSQYTSVLELMGNRSKDRYYYFANILGAALTGLVLLSDDARWTTRMQRKLSKKRCVYKAKSKKAISDHQLWQIKEACLTLSENKTRPTIKIQKQDEKRLLLNMNQTHVPEIMDIFSSADLTIQTLHLEQIGRLSLGDLKEGDYLELTENEIEV